MAVLAICLVVFLAMTGYTSSTYCVCNSGLSDSVLQKNIDYACGNGADCTQILQNGPCFQPNTVKDHCNYAVNSYFQRKGQATGTCDFSGSASPSQTAPAGQSTTCVYPASASSSTTPTTPGGTTPSTTPGGTTPGGGTAGGGTTPGGGTTTTPGGGTSTTPGGGTSTTPGGGTTTTPGGGTTGGFTPPFGGLGPSTGMNNDNSSIRLLHESSINVFLSFVVPLLFSGIMWLKL